MLMAAAWRVPHTAKTSTIDGEVGEGRGIIGVAPES